MDNGLFPDVRMQLRPEKRVADKPQPPRPNAPPPPTSAEKRGLDKNRNRSNPPRNVNQNINNGFDKNADNAVAPKIECKCKPKDVFLNNVNRASNGNEYLKGMIMGEILNSPRFRGRK